jgi:hypothetical protein
MKKNSINSLDNQCSIQFEVWKILVFILVLTTVSGMNAQAFVATRMQSGGLIRGWPHIDKGDPIKWYLNATTLPKTTNTPANPTDLSETDVVNILSNSCFKPWEDSAVNMKFQYSGTTNLSAIDSTDGKFVVYWSKSLPDGAAWGGALAMSYYFFDNDGYIYHSDIVFNDNLTWKINGDPNSGAPYPIDGVADHEIGHSIGLGHPYDGNRTTVQYETDAASQLQVMHWQITQTDPKTSDIYGCRYFYSKTTARQTAASTVRVTFHTGVASAGVVTGSFVVYPTAEGVTVTGAAYVDSTHADLTLSGSLSDSKAYWLGITDGVKDTGGTALFQRDAGYTTGSEGWPSIRIDPVTGIKLAGAMGNSVSLTSSQGPVYVVKDTTVYSGATLAIGDGATLVAPSAITVNTGGTMTVGAGATLKFGPSTGANIKCSGNLQVNGTAASRVKFTSINDNTSGGTTGTGSPAAGDWFSVDFYGGSTDTGSWLKFADLTYGDRTVGFSKYSNSTVPGWASLFNCRISNSSNFGVSINADNVAPVMMNNEISNNPWGMYIFSATADLSRIVGNNFVNSANGGIQSSTNWTLPGNYFTGNQYDSYNGTGAMNLDPKLANPIDPHAGTTTLKFKSDNTYASDISTNLPVGTSLFVESQTSGGNQSSLGNDGKVNSQMVLVKSDSDTTGIWLPLTETSASSGIFRNTDAAASIQAATSQTSYQIKGVDGNAVNSVFPADATVKSTATVGTGGSVASAPVLGHTAANLIPASACVQSTDGLGKITISFRAQDANGDTVTLRNIAVSADNGATWTEVNTASAALTGFTATFTSGTDFTGTLHSFVLDTKHADMGGLFATKDVSTVKVRFKAADGGALVSEYCLTEAFRVDDKAPGVTTAVAYSSLPVSGGQTALTCTFDESVTASAFSTNLNAGGYGTAVAGTNGSATVTGTITTTLKGTDVITSVKCVGSDAFGNAVTSELATAANVKPLQPLAPTVSKSNATLKLVVNANSSETGNVHYAIETTEASTTKYVQTNGTLSTTAAYADRATWGGDNGVVLAGLTDLITAYSFKVYAWNPSATAATDLNGRSDASASAAYSNSAPTISITAPSAASESAGTSYAIKWDDADTDDSATVSLYLDTDTAWSGTGSEVLLLSGIAEDTDGTADLQDVLTLSWTSTDGRKKLSEIPNGTYRICGVISDSVNADVRAWSAGSIVVDNKGTISGITATNLTNTTATIVWTTTEAGKGKTLHGVNAASMTTQTSDARNVDTKVHSVTISALSASTAYRFGVRTDLASATAAGVTFYLDDAQGAGATFTTAAAGTGTAHVLSGKINDENSAAVSGAVVLVKVTNGANVSGYLSAITAADGTFQIDLAGLKASDGSVFAWVNSNPVSIDVAAGDKGTYSSATTINSASSPQDLGTLQTITKVTVAHSLLNGFNMVSVPVTPENPATSATASYSAYDVLDQVSAVGALYSWDASKQSYSSAFRFNGVNIGTDFDILPGKAMWVKSSGASSWNVVGKPFQAPQAITMYRGWNLVGFVSAANYPANLILTYTPETLISAIKDNGAAAADAVYHWSVADGRFFSVIMFNGTPLNTSASSFKTIELNKGYFIKMNTATTFTPTN